MASLINAIDLFCGAGGLSCGLSEAGINVVAGIDNDERCRFPYERNLGAKFLCASVRDLTSKQLFELWGNSKFRLLAGCAPCQPFSSQRKGIAANSHESWNLLDDFSRLISETLPDFVTMENVSPLRHQPIFERFLGCLRAENYHVDFDVIKTERYGLPQQRRRLVLIASRIGVVKIPAPTIEKGKEISVSQALQGLPSLEQGRSCPDDPLHKARSLSPVNQARICASKPGGTWQDWPQELLANCHKRSSGKTFKSFYGIMDGDKPSPTITTQFYNFGSGRFGHPTQKRTITPREAAILQGFPKSYEFLPPNEPVHFSIVGKMIGNAVPPVIGKIVGSEFIRQGLNQLGVARHE